MTLVMVPAHGFGVRYDLPAPLLVYLGAAGAVVALSFVIVAVFVRGGGEDLRYPRLRIDKRPLIGPIVNSGAAPVIGRIFGVAVLAAIVVTGYLGASSATDNPAEYLLWIYAWPLLLMLSAVVGNVFDLVNPWTGIYDLATRLLGPHRARPRAVYPEELGIWPAVVAYLLFAFFELCSGQSANPRAVATAALAYSVYTLAMMAIFGREWLRRGEAFTVLYRLVGAFGPIEVEAGPGERQVYLRPWAVGLSRLELVGADVVSFVMLMLASLAFDGLEATSLWVNVFNSLGGVIEALGGLGAPLVKLGGLLAVTFVFAAFFLLVVRVADRLGGGRVNTMRSSSLFALTLVPIALVYFAAHFYSYVVIQSQGLVPLLADPLHLGWRLLPTAGYKPSFAWTDAGFVWYLQVVLIVLGHVLAVYLAHVRALRLFPTRARALRSQYAMLVLMVLYTCASLWILAQPNAEA